MTEIQGKSFVVQVSARFGRISEGSSYRESLYEAFIVVDWARTFFNYNNYISETERGTKRFFSSFAYEHLNAE